MGHEFGFAEIAAGRITPATVQPWRDAELRRHSILVEAVRRKVLAAGPDREFAAAHRRLADAQHTDPESAARVLAAPQLGAWATRCLPEGDTAAGHLREIVAGLTRPVPRPTVTATHRGLTLTLELDHDDPYLDLYGARESCPDLTAWREVLGEGWRLLTSAVPETAAAMSVTLRVLVPLEPVEPGRLRSATSGWAFGAIATSLPVDAPECAETLLHEFRHVVLGAITNHVLLVEPDATWTGRAPWRPDRRPAEGLLQGCFAYTGLVDLWGRLAGTEYGERAERSLATWHEPTRLAIMELAGSGALTERGESFVAAMLRSL